MEIGQEYLQAQRRGKSPLFSPTNEWCLPAPSVIKREERAFVVDSGAPMHMLSRKDLNSAESETIRVSKSPTTVITANGEVHTKEEATVHVKEFDLFMTVRLLEDTPDVLSLGKLCQDHGYSYEWTRSQKPQLVKDGSRTMCSTANCVPIVIFHRQALQAQLHLHLQHQYWRKQQFSHCIPHQQEVRVRVA